ncbi:hypothetical protein [Nocardia brasiliensis]|nr:hypothetical protein [Nocardia brasiliensis]
MSTPRSIATHHALVAGHSAQLNPDAVGGSNGGPHDHEAGRPVR